MFDHRNGKVYVPPPARLRDHVAGVFLALRPGRSPHVRVTRASLPCRPAPAALRQRRRIDA
jgi:hypothetical protein